MQSKERRKENPQRVEEGVASGIWGCKEKKKLGLVFE